MSRKSSPPSTLPEDQSANFKPTVNFNLSDEDLAELVKSDFSDFLQPTSGAANLLQEPQQAQPFLPLFAQFGSHYDSMPKRAHLAYSAEPAFAQGNSMSEFPQNFGLGIQPQDRKLPSPLYAQRPQALAPEHLASDSTLLPKPVDPIILTIQTLEQHGFDKNFAHSLFSDKLVLRKPSHGSYVIITAITNILADYSHAFIQLRKDLPALSNENIADLLDKRTLTNLSYKYMRSPSQEAFTMITDHFRSKVEDLLRSKDKIINFCEWSRRFDGSEFKEHLTNLAMVYAENNSTIDQALIEAKSFITKTYEIDLEFRTALSKATGTQSQKVLEAQNRIQQLENSRKRQSTFDAPLTRRTRQNFSDTDAEANTSYPYMPQPLELEMLRASGFASDSAIFSTIQPPQDRMPNAAVTSVTPTFSAAAFNIGAKMPSHTKE